MELAWIGIHAGVSFGKSADVTVEGAPCVSNLLGENSLIYDGPGLLLGVSLVVGGSYLTWSVSGGATYEIIGIGIGVTKGPGGIPIPKIKGREKGLQLPIKAGLIYHANVGLLSTDCQSGTCDEN